MRRYIVFLVAIACFVLDYLLGNEVDVTQAWLVPVIAGVSALAGMFQRNAANRMEDQNPFPVAAPNPNLLRNTAIAEQMSQVGLPGQEYSLAQQGLQRNLGGVLRQARAVGGYGVNLPSILRQANYGQQQLDTTNAAARQANQRLAMQTRETLAGEENRVWGWNEQQRYTDLAERIASLRSAGNQNIAGGLGFLGQMYASGAWQGFGNQNAGANAAIQTQLPGAQVQQNQSNYGAMLQQSLLSGYGMAPNPGARV